MKIVIKNSRVVFARPKGWVEISPSEVINSCYYEHTYQKSAYDNDAYSVFVYNLKEGDKVLIQGKIGSGQYLMQYGVFKTKESDKIYTNKITGKHFLEAGTEVTLNDELLITESCYLLVQRASNENPGISVKKFFDPIN